ncbi:MAG: MATE family efflux transporter [Polyangiaceae bacterium]
MATLRSELMTVLRLSLPVSLTQVGLMLTGVLDTAMVGRLGVEELAACALGNMWWWSWMSLGVGLVMGIDPLISQAHGRGDGAAVALSLQRGSVLALIVSVPIVGLMFATEAGLRLLGQNAHVAALAQRYNDLKLLTVPCFLLYSALRQYLQGRTLMAPATWVMWIGNVFHLALNWALIFGHLGFAAHGLSGAAIASSITTVLQLLGLIAWTWGFGLQRGAWRAWDAESFSPRGLWQAARLGLPVGTQVALEVWAFSIATLMAGWLGTPEVASHQVVLSLASLTFMVPLGVSQGASTRVGNLIGEGDAEGMRRAAKASLCIGALAMSLSASLFALLRQELPRIYTDDAAILALAAQLLPIAAAFQLSDGTQVVAGGVLRGMGRPAAAAGANLVGYYAVGLPLAYLLGFRLGGGLLGVWVALAIGLSVVAGLLLYWVRRTGRRPLSELSVSVE